MDRIGLIEEEIQNNSSFIAEHGLSKFYEKSVYLSMPWKFYKKKFKEFYEVLSYIHNDIPEEELIYRPFNIIIRLLKADFNRYYINQKIIIKRKRTSVKDRDGKYIYMLMISYGAKTKKYNEKESTIKNLINEFFLLDGFLVPFFRVIKKQIVLTSEQLDKYRGKKIKYETLRAYLIITQLNVKEELSVPQAIRKAGSEMKIGVVLPGTYYKWRSNHREAYSLLCDGLNKGMSETEIIDCIRPFS